MANIETTAKLIGEKKLIKALKYLPKDIRDKALASSTRVAAKSVAELAKTLAPVRTGRLRDSIKIHKLSKSKVRRWYGDPRDWIIYTVGLTKEGWYGRFVELGTVKMDKHPFMRPAMERSHLTVLNTIKSDLYIKIPKFARKYL